MKRVFFFIQILFLIVLFSGGNRNIEAGNVNMSSLPSQGSGSSVLFAIGTEW